MEYSRDVLSQTKAQLTESMISMGESAYRGRQFFRWLHQKRVSEIGAITEFSAPLRARLQSSCILWPLRILKKQVSVDATVKLLLALADGNAVETVVLSYEAGQTVCISSQVGCAMGCVFCASAAGGRVRNLTAGEMAGQIYASAAETGLRVDRVVVMGIGEPLDNFDNLRDFCDIITDSDGYHLSGRSLTVSTCGIVPRIYELAELRLPLTLSISLHAATDEKRSAIMPINRVYPLSELIPACREYAKVTGRRITFEYAVIHGQNDSALDARGLARLLRNTESHINLIPVNPARERSFSASRGQTAAFQKQLSALGLNATVRRTLGDDIDAACGQLRHRVQQSNAQMTGEASVEDHRAHPSGM